MPTCCGLSAGPREAFAGKSRLTGLLSGSVC